MKEQTILTICKRIEEIKQRPRLVAVDGRCSAGKTTMAGQLADCLTKRGISCNVIHMDDFFLRPAQRTGERLAEPGGNIDYERFETEVLTGLLQGKDFSYRPYDCKTQLLQEPVWLTPADVTILEGAYSCHPVFGSYAGLKIFLTIDEGTQLARIQKRNGAEALSVFRERWIPLEERYFAAFLVEEGCDLVFDSTKD